jgi:hypothetical protein
MLTAGPPVVPLRVRRYPVHSHIPLPLRPRVYPSVKPKEKERMTIVAGFQVVDGILMCSDTQYTSNAKVFQQKLFPYSLGDDSSTYVFALAGHDQNGKMAIDECWDAIQALPVEFRSLRAIRRALQKAVKPICDEYVLSRPSSEQDQQSFELLVGSWIPRGGGHQLLSIGRNGAVNRLDASYGCLGTGSYLGDYFIRPTFDRYMPMHEVMLLAAQVVRVAKSYDPNCGGPSQFVLIGPGAQTRAFPYNFNWSERFLYRYDTYTRRLMFAISNPKSTVEEFDEELERFVLGIQSLRSDSTTTFRPEAQPDPRFPTGDPARQPPSPESRGGKNES